MPPQTGIAGVVAALSVTGDLTRGHPQGDAMRACLLATELARRAGLADPARADVYYATLLRFAGCAATSHDLAARYGGNDVRVRAGGDLIDPTRPGEALRFLTSLGAGAGRLRMLGRAAGAARFYADSMRADCEVGADLTRRLRLPKAVARAVLDGFERFDGKGAPEGRRGTEIAEASRFAAVGYAAVMFDAVGGEELAADTVARWSGRALDPSIAAVFAEAPGELLAISAPDDIWAAAVEAEPPPQRAFADDAALDEALAGFGDAADLKTPWLHGHSGWVARLAGAAAEASGADAGLVHRAGLVHDLGRVAVPTGVWERPGPLRPRSGSSCACIRTTRAASSPARPCWRRSERWPAATTSARTAPGTRPAYVRLSSTRPPACLRLPTSSTPSASRGRTGRRSAPRRRHGCSPGCRSTATPCARCSRWRARRRPRSRRSRPT